jgi:hypothetical protein
MTDSTTSNPLAKYFRQPQLYLKLPSQGQWYPQGSLDMPVTKELPVYPMTAKDELTLKTPDALLNGQSTVDVIQSCIPNIKNAWDIPSVDLDAILIAIRQATYGNRLELTTVCPHCSAKNEHDIDLGWLSSRISCPNYEETIHVGGLELFLKPHSYKDFNQASIENYEHQKLIAVVSNEELSDAEKQQKFNDIFHKLLDLTVFQVTKSVGGIKTPDGTVVEERQHIDEFFKNSNKDVWDAVKSRLEEFNKSTVTREVELTCDSEECGKPYTSPMIFELSSFFA